MIQKLRNIDRGNVEGSLYMNLYGDKRERILSIYNGDIDEDVQLLYEKVCSLLFEVLDNSYYELSDDNMIVIEQQSKFLYSIYELCCVNRIVYEGHNFMKYGKDNNTEIFTRAKSILRSGPGIPESWSDMFYKEDFRLNIAEISSKLYTQYGDVQYPSDIEDIFKCFHFTNYNNLKVVLIGQDPYHQEIVVGGRNVSKAVGLSFSIRKEDRKIPMSLKNIFKRMRQTISRTVEIDEQTHIEDWMVPNHGDLSEYAKQGVLLLNTYLTVCPIGKAGSHSKLWGNFVRDNIIRYINENFENVIFLLWGRKAQGMENVIGDKHYVLKTSHPSGFSYNRGFHECDHFNEINQILLEVGKEPVDWFNI